MEQSQIHGKGHWYHETQSSRCDDAVLPLVPEAAWHQDRFLFDLSLNSSLKTTEESWLAIARESIEVLLPENSPVTRLHTLSSYDRLSTALTVAQMYGVQRLCNHYAARLAPQPGPDSSRESNRRLTQITQYARQLASLPTLIDDASRLQLDEVGLSVSDIVTFNQLIGFIGFQARVIAVVQALQALPVRTLPGLESQQDAAAALFQSGEQYWQPGIPVLEPRYASDWQLEALNLCAPQRVLSDMGWVLAHDAPALCALSQLTNFILTPTSLPADSMVLVSLLSARINGSVSCFTDVARFWPNDDGLPEAMRNGDRALQAWSHSRPKERAIIQATSVLTRTPASFSSAQIHLLLEQGFTPAQALRLLVGSGLLGWINRLKIGIGNSG